MQLKLVDAIDGVIRVKSVGEINPTSAEQLQDPLIEMCGPRVFQNRVTLDLEESEFISSSGIGRILHWHKRFEQQGGKLEICSLSRSIDQVFRLMRLESVLHLC